jgi:stearoyl-CoA desaturase (delta-9 desaturase)
MNLGKNVFLIFLPFHLLGLIGLFYLNQYLLEFFVIWFFVGIIGNGVAGHRYFAHGQFQTSVSVKWLLGFLSTLGAIGPIHYWVIQHKTHHIKADKEGDPHDPRKGLFYTFYTWTFPQGSNEKEYMKERFAKRLAISMSQDNFYLFFQKNHYLIIYIFCLLLLIINPILLTIYALAYCIDFFRLGLVNYFCHGYGYRNHNTTDKSTNNFIIGMLTLGFGWHNNHHANPGKLVLTERWWEIDIEGYIGYLLSKF